MIGVIARKLFGSSNERRIKGYLPRVAQINALEKELAGLSDEALRKLYPAEALVKLNVNVPTAVLRTVEPDWWKGTPSVTYAVPVKRVGEVHVPPGTTNQSGFARPLAVRSRGS